MEIYEKRVVLFLDILGFRSLIRSGKERVVLNVLDIMPKKTHYFDQKMLDSIDFRVTSFSDCIVASAKFLSKSNFLPAFVMTHYAATVALTLLSEGILCRGAITVGKLHHRGQHLFGPALIDAYELESTIAQYPRIIVPNKVASGIVMSIFMFLGMDWLDDNRPFMADFDGVEYLDLLGPCYTIDRPSSLLNKGSTDIKNLGQQTVSLVMSMCRSKKKDYRVAVKYEWLQTYLLDCCKRFGWKVPSSNKVLNMRSTTFNGFKRD